MARFGYLAVALSLLLLASIIPTHFLGSLTPKIPRAQAATLPIRLDGDALNGWNGSTTNPNPTITVHPSDTVSLTLVSSDHAPHRFLLDADVDGAADTADCPTTDPCSISFSTSTTYSFPVNNLQAKTYTYFCTVHPTTMFGSFVVAPDFSISANPTTLNVAAGNFATSQIALTSNGFTGTVALTPAVAPITSTITTTLKPSSVTLSSGGTGTSTLNVTTTPFTPLGTYTVTVTGISSSLSHSTPVTVVVTSGTVGANSLNNQLPALHVSVLELTALIIVTLSITGIYLRRARRNSLA
jgi:plastocyanin